MTDKLDRAIRLEDAIDYCRNDWQCKDGFTSLYEEMDIIIERARSYITLATEAEQLRKERDEYKATLQSIVKEADINALTLYHTLEGGFKYMAGKVTEINFKAQKALKG
jgi:hypothetical protein